MKPPINNETMTQTIPFKTSKAEGVFVRVPDYPIIRAVVQRAVRMDEVYELVYAYDTGKYPVINNAPLPDGYSSRNVECLYPVNDLTEQQWAEVVDDPKYVLEMAYTFYRSDSREKPLSLPYTATESGQSLMRSLGITEGNWVMILKR